MLINLSENVLLGTPEEIVHIGLVLCNPSPWRWGHHSISVVIEKLVQASIILVTPQVSVLHSSERSIEKPLVFVLII